ncbi:hypothetical protein LTR62_002791 [Meristemomyces frigidus]|uniref:Uncharacterized protein n=1 Tax=Meristemomyces frigidus TaxID=1508187 RepID=A0AAN7TXM9_9PEZI|nr:hypothetical protein LTR62_002791 [Meristemomyces frigidus]
MAEVAPLTSAHSHGRKAAFEAQHNHWSATVHEHQSAARDFARTARTTNDGEALRVLKLLEEQHQKLARLVNLQSTDEGGDHSSNTPLKSEAASSKPDPTNAAVPCKGKTTPTKSSRASVLAESGVGSQIRDASPSLARDIASRRGIPQSSRPSPAAQARARQLSPESDRKRVVKPRIPSSVVDSQVGLAKQEHSSRAIDDEGFAKFYSGLTTSTMSKLSSVLAFAGLPLTVDDIKAEATSTSRSSKQTVSASNDPDVRKLFSKAALAAVEEDHRQRGTFGRGFGPAESFYVVPPTGMTTSFADIARRRGLEDDEDDFVDAREAPGPASSKPDRTSQGVRASFGRGRTQEELELENSTLKTTLEQLAGRLANFEAHAQDASMAALTQSVVALRSSTTTTPKGLAVEWQRQLEEQMEKAAEEKQTLEAQVKQQQKELKRYEAKYVKLYERAKVKQHAKELARKVSDDGGAKAVDEAIT